MYRMLISSAIFVAVAFASASATIINIPDDYATIQEGIDASTDGDTVLVQPGIYEENINFNGHEIVLGSMFLTTGDTTYIAETVIDGDSSGSVVTFENAEDSTALITGFTVQNGYAQMGGGILCMNSSPTIMINLIKDNMTFTYGATYGGGIHCGESSDASIIENNITQNQAQFGGGISCTFDSSPVIAHNIINEDSAEWGGGIYCYNSDPYIHNNIISDNEVFGLNYGRGGGICCRHSDPIIIGNTISRNIAIENGGIYCSDSSPIITNTICWFNTPVEISGAPSITYSDIQGGWEGEGNIDTDPLFVDPVNRNFNICTQSPCIDAGDPDMYDPDGSRADIGVYFAEHPECDLRNIRYVSTTGDDMNGDGSPENPFRTIQYAIGSSHYGDTVIVEEGTYFENVSFAGNSVVLGSMFLLSGDSSYISSTIIDGGSSGTVVSLQNGEDSTAEIAGFTIQNGYETEGGGIVCNYSSPTIRDNIISQNSTSGIRCQFYANPEIRNNIVQGNTIGAGIYCRDNSHPNIVCNTISENSGGRGGGIYIRRCGVLSVSDNLMINNVAEGSNHGQGGAIYCHFSSPNISGNVIANNAVYGADDVSDGGGIYCWNSIPIICENVLSGNISGSNYGYGGAISLWDCSGGTVSGNIIFDNYAGDFGGDGGDGGGIYLQSSSPTVSFNLILGNSATRNGGGIYSSSYSWPDMRNNTITGNAALNGGGNYLHFSYLTIANTIFWDNTAENGAEIYVHQGSPVIIYCDILGGWPGEGNIDADPLFCCPDTLNYWLAEDSPCIGAGCDSLGNPDSSHNIGAFGIGCEVPTDIPDQHQSIPSQFSLSQNYPNPFNASTTMKYGLYKSSHVLIQIYDILGRRVETLFDGLRPAGCHSVTWKSGDNSSGVYFYRIQAGEYAETRKMVLLR